MSPRLFATNSVGCQQGFRRAILFVDGFVYEAQRFDQPHSLSVFGRKLAPAAWLWLLSVLPTKGPCDYNLLSKLLEQLGERFGNRDWKLVSGDNEPTEEYLIGIHERYSHRLLADFSKARVDKESR
jgi:hypothetical protein